MTAASGISLSSGIDAKYVYAFSVWPSETWGFDPAVFELFKMWPGRVETIHSASEFERFRSGLSHHGITLREIERVPHSNPEPVF